MFSILDMRGELLREERWVCIDCEERPFIIRDIDLP